MVILLWNKHHFSLGMPVIYMISIWCSPWYPSMNYLSVIKWISTIDPIKYCAKCNFFNSNALSTRDRQQVENDDKADAMLSCTDNWIDDLLWEMQNLQVVMASNLSKGLREMSIKDTKAYKSNVITYTLCNKERQHIKYY